MADLVEQARQGRPRAVARLISLIEDEDPVLPELMARLTQAAPETAPAAVPEATPGSRAAVIGLTGPPGVGKSTLTAALIGHYRVQGLRVGVLAVDPSSPFTGGALLGDRIRMQDHGLDQEVFIRSMATRGHLGGLARATPQALRVLDAAGCDVVLIETVGVGQSEVEVAALADTTVVLTAPGAGDGVQAAKAGVLEIADVLVVNKADREGAAATARDLRQMISHGQRLAPGGWRPPVVTVVASTGTGIDALLDALQAHRDWSAAGTELVERRRRRAAVEIEALALAELRRRAAQLEPGRRPADLAEAVDQGRLDPYTAAATLLEAVGEVVP